MGSPPAVVSPQAALSITCGTGGGPHRAPQSFPPTRSARCPPPLPLPPPLRPSRRLGCGRMAIGRPWGQAFQSRAMTTSLNHTQTQQQRRASRLTAPRRCGRRHGAGSLPSQGRGRRATQLHHSRTAEQAQPSQQLAQARSKSSKTMRRAQRSGPRAGSPRRQQHCSARRCCCSRWAHAPHPLALLSLKRVSTGHVKPWVTACRARSHTSMQSSLPCSAACQHCRQCPLAGMRAARVNLDPGPSPFAARLYAAGHPRSGARATAGAVPGRPGGAGGGAAARCRRRSARRGAVAPAGSRPAGAVQPGSCLRMAGLRPGPAAVGCSPEAGCCGAGCSADGGA